jgi:integrase
MAWIEDHQKADGGLSYAVCWRLGGTRTGKRQRETFGAGSEERNKAQAEGFLRMVVAAGESWPDGWIKGQGFVREKSHVKEPDAAPRKFHDVGLDYVNQIVGCSPGQRARYRSQIRLLDTLEVKGASGLYKPFGRLIGEITEDDVKAWLIGWDRSMKTKANYHGLMTGVFNYAMERGLVSLIPTLRTAPKKGQIKQSQADLRFLTEKEFATTAKSAGDAADMLKVDVGTGIRFGELTALWVSDVDLKHKTIRINKAWKREGEDGERDVPAWLAKQLRDKHTMRGHYLGNPKTPKSRRTIEISDSVAAILKRVVKGRAQDDFVFVTEDGAPWHNSDFYINVWSPLMTKVGEQGVGAFRFHDLRHTHVSWLISGGVPLPHIQARLGHESITTTIDTYGHLLPVGDDLISQVVDTALRGEEIRPALRVIKGGKKQANAS